MFLRIKGLSINGPGSFSIFSRKIDDVEPVGMIFHDGFLSSQGARMLSAVPMALLHQDGQCWFLFC